MVDCLMVENWTTNVSYEKYYAQCAPASCTYSKVQQRSFMFALTKAISLLATLTLVIGIIIPQLLSFIRSRLNPEPSPTVTSE